LTAPNFCKKRPPVSRRPNPCRGVDLADFLAGTHMKPAIICRPSVIAIAAVCWFITPAFARAQGIPAQIVEIRGGTATFHAATNVPAIAIHGKSTALEGRARIRQIPNGLVIEDLEAILPVDSLNTGMGLRDKHMREYVFKTPEGKVPDVRFVADRVVCANAGAANDCQLAGSLIIRGTPRPFALALKVISEGSAFRATGDGVVKLSTYGIPCPSQLGVTAKDDVKLHMDFTVKRMDDRIAQGSR
jgi:polyisoprenoid-binding protein YceI